MFSSQFENTVSSAASDAAVIKTKNTNQNAAVPIKPAILFEILTVLHFNLTVNTDYFLLFLLPYAVHTYPRGRLNQSLYMLIQRINIMCHDEHHIACR